MSGGPVEPGGRSVDGDHQLSGAVRARGTGPGTPSPASREEPARLTAWVEGRVQGVGFRWWVRARALELGLVGWAQNLPDRRVKVVAEGPGSRCRDLLALLEGGSTPGRVSRVTHRWSPTVGGIGGFTER